MWKSSFQVPVQQNIYVNYIIVNIKIIKVPEI